ncbi:MAG TPA: peptidoglycan-binding protein [Thiobacillus sp.]
MVFDNFDVVMQWNHSVNYALAVAHLAHRIAGGGALVARPGEAGALSTMQLKAMQQALNDLGLDAGAADGLPGPRTQTAIRLFQALHQMPVDGYPAPSVLAHIEHTHAAAGTLVRKPAPTFADPEGQP